MRLRAWTAAAVLAAGMVAAAPSAQAAADDGGLLWTNGQQVLRSTLEFTDPVNLAQATPGSRVQDLTTSPDGSRFAYVEHTDVGTSYREQLVVRRADGSDPVVVGDTGTPTTKGFGDISLSMHGTYVSFRSGNGCFGYASTSTAGSATSYEGDGLCSFSHFRFLRLSANEAFGFAIDPYGTLRAGLPSHDRYQPTKVTGIDQDISSFTISRDGTHIAWSRWSPTTTYDNAEIWLGDLADQKVTGAHLVVPHNTTNVDPGLAFSPDGTRLYYDLGPTGCCSRVYSDLYYVPVAGGDPVQLTQTAGVSEPDVQPIGPPPPPPPAPTSRGAALYDDHPTIRWTTVGPTATGTSIVRTGGGQPALTLLLGRATQSIADDRLRIGRDYTYTLRSSDAFGQYSEPLVIQLTALRTSVTTPELASDTSVQPAYPVTFPAATSAKVWWSDLSAGTPYEPWNVAPTGTHVLGAEGGTTLIAGHTYAVRLQVVDTFGNVGHLTTSSTHVPLDQNGFAFSGTTASVGAPTLWRTTARVLRPGASAALQMKSGVSWAAVIGSKCTSCGWMVVRRGSTVVATVDTNGPRLDRQVLYSGYGSGPLTITVQSRGSHRDVVLDGYATGL